MIRHLLTKARFWLIHKIAGRSSIILNVTLCDATVYLAPKAHSLMAASAFHGCDVWCQGRLVIGREEGVILQPEEVDA